jgi:dTDP-4-amino-4,6-dideoxygalactose transaminase
VTDEIPFNRPYSVGSEYSYIGEAIDRGHLSCNGAFSERCEQWLESQTRSAKAMLVHSCTAALELAAMLADVGPGDEVIMPSYTFVSTANAFVLRGAVPVFVDIRPDTLNLDERLVEAAITDRTKAIVPVHYAGVGCEMDEVCEIADRHGLLVIEDAAQGVMAAYRGRALGSIGALGAMSFHETKNVTCGEGGALLINDPRLVARAEMLREKGTNRRRFERGEVDRYTWVDIGSSYGLSDLSAAFLWAQLQEAEAITGARRAVWDRYHVAFGPAEDAGFLRRPVVPPHCEINAHLYYLLMPTAAARTQLLDDLAGAGINAVFHYVPLHSSPAGRRYGRTHGSMNMTDELSARLVRLPLWPEMPDAAIDRVVDVVLERFAEVSVRRGRLVS